MDGTTHNRELLGTELSMDECKELCLQDSDCKAIEHWMLKSECYKCIDPSKRYPRSIPTTYPTVIEKGQSGYEGNLIYSIYQDNVVTIPFNIAK